MPTLSKPSYVLLKKVTKTTLRNDPTQTSISYLSIGSGSSRTGSSLPGWKKIIQQGGNATTNMTATLLDRKSVSPIQASWKARPSFGIKYMSEVEDTTNMRLFLTYSDIPSNLMSNLQNQAAQKAYQQLSKGINGATVFGELRQTVSMIRKPALAFRRGIDAYTNVARRIRDKSRTRKQFLKAISDTWLEYSFGWQPLLNDVRTYAQALAESENGPPITRFKATYREVYKVPRAQVLDTNLDGGYCNSIIYRKGEAECSVSYQGAAKIGVSGYSRHSALFGTGIPSFLPAAWELMPYSFLIDYFSNVGAVLDAVATAQYVAFNYTSATSRILMTTELTSRVYNGNPQGDLTATDGSAVWTSKQIQRKSIGNVPLPTIQLSNKLSTSKGLNIAALITSRFLDSHFRKR